mgnify:FL=1
MKTLLKSIHGISPFILIPIFYFGIVSAPEPQVEIQPVSKAVFTGLDVLARDNFAILEGKKVGLITNQTGVNRKLIQNVELFLESPNVDLQAVFSPEHGFSGTVSAGEKVNSSEDVKTGIPFYSLYGENQKPTPDMLKGLDVLVFDIQDIGIRSYTYMSTMGLAMEAAGEVGIDFIVLDRPNPMNGEKIEGNILDLKFSSFIGMYPIPYVYGLTPGELARMINEEKWMGSTCNLNVIKMENWDRKTRWDKTQLNWKAPSPNVPKSITPNFMVSTGIMGELGVFSIGIGTEFPFELMGAPWIKEIQFTDKMNQLNLPDISFLPITFSPKKGLFQGEKVHGVHLQILDVEKAELIKIQFYFMEIHQQLYPEKNPFELTTPNQLLMFNKVLGTDQITDAFSKRLKVEDIVGLINPDLSNFREISKPYYLYD